MGERPSLARGSRSGMVGLTGFEPVTSPLSGVRSNQLSYRPDEEKRYHNENSFVHPLRRSERNECAVAAFSDEAKPGWLGYTRLI